MIISQGRIFYLPSLDNMQTRGCEKGILWDDLTEEDCRSCPHFICSSLTDAEIRQYWRQKNVKYARKLDDAINLIREYCNSRESCCSDIEERCPLYYWCNNKKAEWQSPDEWPDPTEEKY